MLHIARLDERVQQLEAESIARQSRVTSTTFPSTAKLQHEHSLQYADNPTAQFISSVTQASPTDQSDPKVQTHHGPSQITSSNGMIPRQVSLPPREIADEFVDCYERMVYPMFPVLHLPTFKRRYIQLWEQPYSGQAVDTTFEGTINMVFALGCVNSSKIEPALILKTASTFYKRARGVMPLDSLDSPSIEVVQYLLLTGNYLSFTKYSHRYCNTMAVAIQVAQIIGLNQAQKQASSNQLQWEMGKRVWHLCLTMQRLMSSLFGWSSVVMHDNTCPLPEMIDDEYLLDEGAGIQSPGRPCLLDALAIGVRIFSVVAEAREVNLTSFTGEAKMSELTSLIELDGKLNNIEADLPHHLKYDSKMGDTPRDKVLRFQAEVTNLRIIYVRLLLLRPSLLATARQLLTYREPEPVIQQSRIEVTLRNETFQICVHNALLALHILHTNLQSSAKIISANALHVTLSATTVLISSSIIPSIGGNLEDVTSPHALGVMKAFEILEGHEPRVEGAAETRSKLQQFLETVKNATRIQQGGKL
ncbi:hypothetical protein KAF25_006865 [Fusarium avenaceum]|uniref:Xylanolytic transcriptional activator regulatory domain-containing protein n=1 Tax=Fusarium avenaceum TaxID=40199 RepID=A0A9P7GYZ2_9HYPO|nr:hypothetical protein KAF25_006865 [Fusarium avenaceum]